MGKLDSILAATQAMLKLTSKCYIVAESQRSARAISAFLYDCGIGFPNVVIVTPEAYERSMPALGSMTIFEKNHGDTREQGQGESQDHTQG